MTIDRIYRLAAHVSDPTLDIVDRLIRGPSEVPPPEPDDSSPPTVPMRPERLR